MKRLLTAALASATLVGAVPAIAQDSQMQQTQMQDENMTMLTGKVYRALRDCEIDTDMIDSLTMTQVSGIVLQSNSGSGGDNCEQIQAIAMNEEG